MKKTLAYELGIQRIRLIMKEETVRPLYREYFKRTAAFLLEIDRVYEKLRTTDWERLSLEELEEMNIRLYRDIKNETYANSFANPSHAVEKMGEIGVMLSALYKELRGEISYAFEENEEYLIILNNLFIEVYNLFEEEMREVLETEDLKKRFRHILYWHTNDYCEVFVEDRIAQQVDPEVSLAKTWIMELDWSEKKSLYRYGEHIGENEIGLLEFFKKLPQDEVEKIARVYTNGYHEGFVNTGKDIGKKETVNIRYPIGMERMVKEAILQFEELGLSAVIYPGSLSMITGNGAARTGYQSTPANRQYDYDHGKDLGLVFDKRWMERKLEVMEHAFEKRKHLAKVHGGPAVIETFGGFPFVPEQKKEAVSYDEKQEEWMRMYRSKSGEITNRYIPGEERSFTIIAYPVPEIGERFEEIFRETVKINTLDVTAYRKIQQYLIDALDQGVRVSVKGCNGNKTDMTVALTTLQNPEKETLFENCLADVNIPVGEVFTSPQLEGTNGILHVSKVFLNELEYRDLSLTLKEGMVVDYHCGNYEEEEEGRKYIYENILFRHESLPLGEFAIGTNTTAYVMGKKYDIQDKLPILIAEKTGPHFAVGDTCYSHEEDNHMYNPDGKEIVAKENSCSKLRKEDPGKAYFHCHTDITIPYEELGEIRVYREDGTSILLIKNGRFVLPGTEALNRALEGLQA